MPNRDLRIPTAFLKSNSEGDTCSSLNLYILLWIILRNYLRKLLMRHNSMIITPFSSSVILAELWTHIQSIHSGCFYNFAHSLIQASQQFYTIFIKKLLKFSMYIITVECFTFFHYFYYHSRKSCLH